MSDSEVSKRRFRFLFIIPAAALIVLACRVVYLQAMYGGEFSERARRQQMQITYLPARPGNIFAKTRSGSDALLAGSNRIPGVFADPVLLGEERFGEASEKVAAVLQCRPEELYEKIFQRRDKRFVYLARGVTDSQADAIKKLDIRGVQIIREWRRNYPRNRCWTDDRFQAYRRSGGRRNGIPGRQVAGGKRR